MLRQPARAGRRDAPAGAPWRRRCRLFASLLALTASFACIPAAAPAHEGDPDFRSEVLAVEPAPPGLTVEVLNYDDRLLLRNETGRTVTVLGYDGEPYARLLADGTVEVNRRSPTTYLNEDRFARVDLPGLADAAAAPEWETVGRDGRFEWHDHRIHWMSENRPPRVEDPDRRTKIFDWRVPIELGGERGEVRGELWWVPLPGGGPPLGALLGLAAVLIAGAVAVLIVRRRRGSGRAENEQREAW